jgi:hypothetical protein
MTGLHFAYFLSKEGIMKNARHVIDNANGKLGWVLLWALGIPIPVLLILYFVRGCT